MFNTHLYSCYCHKKLFKDHLIFIVLKKSCNKVVFIIFCDKSFMFGEFKLLPARASKQGNVIGLVSVYIYICHQNFF